MVPFFINFSEMFSHMQKFFLIHQCTARMVVGLQAQHPISIYLQFWVGQSLHSDETDRHMYKRRSREGE